MSVRRTTGTISQHCLLITWLQHKRNNFFLKKKAKKTSKRGRFHDNREAKNNPGQQFAGTIQSISRNGLSVVGTITTRQHPE